MRAVKTKFALITLATATLAVATLSSGMEYFDWGINQTVPSNSEFQWSRELTADNRASASTGVCSELSAYNGKQNNAVPTLQKCIDRTPSGGVLEIPPGKYLISGTTPAVITKSISLRTKGKTDSSSRCNYSDDKSCAELVIGPQFYSNYGGAIAIASKKVILDHIVINGNKNNRLSSPAKGKCEKGENLYGFNINVASPEVTITNSVFKNALCGSGLGVSMVKNSKFANNSVVSNGFHNKKNLWSDGMTVNDGSDSVFDGNYFADNTDVDFIFGGCARCKITNNTVVHSSNTSQGSFAAIMIHAWAVPGYPGNLTSGNFAGANIAGNSVDCGPAKACGIGILLGSDPWYEADTYSGSVHDNTVKNAQQGFNIDDVKDTQVYNNTVSSSGGTFKTSCGTRKSTFYNVSPDSRVAPVPSGGRADKVDSRVSWANCIPNWGL